MPACNPDREAHEFPVSGRYYRVVEIKKSQRRANRDSLVPVDEGMVYCKGAQKDGSLDVKRRICGTAARSLLRKGQNAVNYACPVASTQRLKDGNRPEPVSEQIVREFVREGV